jgi:hypothetical protein
MKHLYIQALKILDQLIKDCGVSIRDSQDEFSMLYWKTQLAANQSRRRLIMTRSKLQSNVVHVDFKNKQRKAA